MTIREAVEKFHLVFLKHFAPVAGAGTICLKGGVNLRLYHNSPRLSEDIDFDARKVGVEILKKNVNKVLTGRPLLLELAASGMEVIEVKAAKQTATVQRWKVQLVHQAVPVATRLEFSRRVDEEFESCRVEPPSPLILAEHRVVPFVFNHYTAGAAYLQKVHALALRTQVQARDVFDLDHLSALGQSGAEVSPQIAARARDQLALITYEMFREQVVPFLPADLAEYHGTPAAWKALVARVGNALERIAQPAKK